MARIPLRIFLNSIFDVILELILCSIFPSFFFFNLSVVRCGITFTSICNTKWRLKNAIQSKIHFIFFRYVHDAKTMNGNLFEKISLKILIVPVDNLRKIGYKIMSVIMSICQIKLSWMIDCRTFNQFIQFLTNHCDCDNTNRHSSFAYHIYQFR